jgi:cobalamin transport system substrate-binding protein
MTVRRLPLFFVACIAATALAMSACGGGGSSSKTATPPASANDTFPAQLQRSDGKTVSLTGAPKRLVSLSPGATEIIYALGAEGELAAVDKNADYPDGAKNFATKLDALQPNVESILELQPDLVIIATDANGVVAALDRVNVPVLFSDINIDVRAVDDVLGQIKLIGAATGKSANADSLIADLRGRIDAVTSKLQDVSAGDGPSVYHELDDTYYTASTGSFVGDIYNVLKAKNIAGDGGGSAYPQLTQETIIAANPQAIVLADEAFGTTPDAVKARPGWGNIDAVKNGKIFGVDPDIISRPGPRIVDALEQVAKDLYPDRFS